jgi:hypothetical protein
MATGMDAIIFEVLTERLKTLTPALPIAAPNVVFPAQGQSLPTKYLAVSHLINQTRQVTIGTDQQQKRGLYQVSVVFKLGIGILSALETVETIIALFKDQILTSSGVRVKIDNEPWAASPITEDDRVQITITISWHAFA